MTMTIADGIAALSGVTPTIISNVTAVLDLFMTPPLVFFTGAAFIFVSFKIAAYLLRQVTKTA
jgi:hypothetical protein